jgi:hypothetical protein
VRQISFSLQPPYFFCQLCTKELSRTVIDKLEQIAHVLLCKLEKIFPPGFFNQMEHMILHLPREARLGGPVQNRWCYPIERVCKVLRSTCKNKNKIEACIAEAQILQEVSNFTTKYYAEHLPSVHNRPPRYNTEENASAFSEDNLEVQVFGRERPYLLKSGALS